MKNQYLPNSNDMKQISKECKKEYDSKKIADEIMTRKSNIPGCNIDIKMLHTRVKHMQSVQLFMKNIIHHLVIQ